MLFLKRIILYWTQRTTCKVGSILLPFRKPNAGLMGLQFPFVILTFFAGLVLAFQHEHNQQMKAAVLEESRLELDGLAYNALLVLSSKHNCRINFKGHSFSGAGGSSTLQADQIRMTDITNMNAANVSPNGTVLRKGQESGFVRVESIELVKGNRVVAGSKGFRGELRIIAKNRHQQELRHTLPAYFVMQSAASNVIEDCSVSTEIEGNNTIEDMMCKSYNLIPGTVLADYYPPPLPANTILKYDPSYLIGCRLMTL